MFAGPVTGLYVPEPPAVLSPQSFHLRLNRVSELIDAHSIFPTSQGFGAAIAVRPSVCLLGTQVQSFWSARVDEVGEAHGGELQHGFYQKRNSFVRMVFTFERLKTGIDFRLTGL